MGVYGADGSTETVEEGISATAGSVEKKEAPAKEEVQPETEAEEASASAGSQASASLKDQELKMISDRLEEKNRFFR